MNALSGREENFARILAFCTTHKDAQDIAKEINTTDMTSRKYMKVLIESGYVSYIEKSHKAKSMRKIISKVTELPQIELRRLCRQYRERFMKESVKANAIKKEAAAAEAKAIEEEKKKVIGTIDKKTGARVISSSEYHWTRPSRKSGKVHASGASLSMVIATANF